MFRRLGKALAAVSVVFITSCTDRAAAPPPETPLEASTCGAVSVYPFFGKTTCFLATEEFSLVEGDIAIPSAQDEITREAVAISGHEFRWPGGVIPVEISPEISDPAPIVTSMLEFSTRTPVRFRPRRSTDSDYVAFVLSPPDAPGCGYSMVGRRGGRQVISLNPNCMSPKTIVHEIGHTVGLWHEQSREDRDQYVRVNLSNVEPGLEFNFDRKILNGDDIGTYDYASIMHYGANYFAVDPRIPTIYTRDSSKQGLIGTTAKLSDGDVRAVINLYGLRVDVIARTESSATIQWEFPISARGSLRLGTSASWLTASSVVPEETRLSNGSYRYRAVLTSLTKDRKYFYQVQVEVPGKSPLLSAVQNFSTDLRAPKILASRVWWNSTTKHYVVSWETSEPASEYVELTPTEGLAFPLILSDEANLTHHHEVTIPLFILGRNKDYRVVIRGMDAQGNAAQEKALDFRTVNAAPFLGGFRQFSDHSSITLGITSDVPAEFTVHYGRSKLDQVLVPGGEATPFGNFTIPGLAEWTWYSVRIDAKDPITGLVAKGPTRRIRTTDRVEVLTTTDIAATGRKPAKLHVRASSSLPGGALLRVEVRDRRGETFFRTFMRRESGRTNTFVAEVPPLPEGTGSLFIRSFKGGTAGKMMGAGSLPPPGFPSEIELSL